MYTENREKKPDRGGEIKITTRAPTTCRGDIRHIGLIWNRKVSAGIFSSFSFRFVLWNVSGYRSPLRTFPFFFWPRDSNGSKNATTTMKTKPFWVFFSSVPTPPKTHTHTHTQKFNKTKQHLSLSLGTFYFCFLSERRFFLCVCVCVCVCVYPLGCFFFYWMLIKTNRVVKRLSLRSFIFGGWCLLFPRAGDEQVVDGGGLCSASN